MRITPEMVRLEYDIFCRTRPMKSLTCTFPFLVVFYCNLRHWCDNSHRERHDQHFTSFEGGHAHMMQGVRSRRIRGFVKLPGMFSAARLQKTDFVI